MPIHEATAITRITDDRYEPAGFWIRLWAHLFDGIMFQIFFVLSVSILEFAASRYPVLSFLATPVSISGAIIAMYINTVLAFVWSATYIYIFCRLRGATPGKLLFGMTVLNKDTDERLSFGTTI